MKRFVDIRGQDTGYRFAWWDTIIDAFEQFDSEQAWDTWDEFAEVCPIEKQSRYKRLCPQWVFELFIPTNDVQPMDWEHIYTVRIDGRTLDAMKFLAAYVLKSELPSLSAIGAADCIHCFQRDVRAGDERGCIEHGADGRVGGTL